MLMMVAELGLGMDNIAWSFGFIFLRSAWIALQASRILKLALYNLKRLDPLGLLAK